MKNDGGPAFPIVKTDRDGRCEYKEGMSLRDWFAGQALSGLLAASNVENRVVDIYVLTALDYADAMLKVRKNEYYP